MQAWLAMAMGCELLWKNGHKSLISRLCKHDPCGEAFGQQKKLHPHLFHVFWEQVEGDVMMSQHK
jgi:hypothetical protein